jgi:hypothetical protein
VSERGKTVVVLFRLVYLCAALLSSAAGVLVVVSVFIPDYAPRVPAFLGIHLAVGAVFLGVGVLLAGVQRHVAGIAALAAHWHAAEPAQRLAAHLSRLLAYLLAGGGLLCTVLGAVTYGILERIQQGFAVFG